MCTSSPRRRRILLLAALAATSVSCATPRQGTQAAPAAAPAAALEDAGPLVYGEDEVDLPARPLAPIEPAYPTQLRAMGLEGDVEARVLVLADGSVGGAQLLASSDDAFAAAVRRALKEARFHPAERRGRPVASWVTLRLRFRLAN